MSMNMEWKSSSHNTMSYSGAGTRWKSSGRAVKLNLFLLDFKTKKRKVYALYGTLPKNLGVRGDVRIDLIPQRRRIYLVYQFI